MDWISIKDKLPGLIRKYKYAILILLIGVILILLPEGKSNLTQEPVINTETENILSIEEQISQVLSLMKGAGKVRVMLAVASGEETFYQLDENSSMSENTNSIRTETVTVSDADRRELGLIRQVNPPVYLGAIVVCEGADNPVVRLAVVEAVSDITGLGADRISVLKMK